MKINQIKQKIDKSLKVILSNESWLAFTLIGISFILRVTVALLTFSENQIDSWADSKEFLWFGEQFALGNFNPYWSVEEHGLEVGPFVPLIIALFIKIFESPIWPFFIYNCLLTSIIPFVLYLIGKNVFNKKIGLFSAFWSILYPDFYRFNIQFLKEPSVYFFLPLIVLLIILSIKNKDKLIYLFGSAVAFSILMHTDPRYLFYLPIILIPFLFVKWALIDRFIKILSWIVICLLLSMPMLVRNYNIYGEIIFITPQTIAITNKIWKSSVEPYNKSFLEQRLQLSINNFDGDEFKTAEDKYYEQRLENALRESSGKGRTPYKYGDYEKYFMAFKHYWQPIFFSPNYLYHGFRYQKWSIRHNFSSLIFYGIFLPFYFIGIYLIIRKKDLFAIYIVTIPLFHSIMHAYALMPLERYRSHINFCIIITALWTMFYILKNYKLINKIKIK
tara:strand:+ start:580 stop:1917 length:1338 start_codon:yes stop_codon:yes gene_type:complete